MGKPASPSREEIKVMKTVANNLKTEIVVADKTGSVNFQQSIAPWSLVLIEQMN
jgi:xylan 1,4-beta-xylosidase